MNSLIIQSRSGYGSESEIDDTGPDSHIMLPQGISGKGNIKSQQSAIRLTEVQLIKKIKDDDWKHYILIF